MNKKKIILIVILSFVSVFVLATDAFATDLGWVADTNVSIGGNTYVILSGSAATTFTVSGTTAIVTVPSTSTFVFKSNEKFKLNNNGSINQVCSSSANTITIHGPNTVTITPDATHTCSSGGSSSGGSLSSKPFTPAPSVTPLTTLPVGGVTAPSTTSSTYVFGINLVKFGTKGDDCKAWQAFFNKKAGAHLVLDSICGKLSIAVAKAWQASQGLVADGLLGPKSRAKANTQ